MPKSENEIVSTTKSKPFNSKEFTENVIKGAVIGSVSTTMTFGLIDKPLAYATKTAATGSQSIGKLAWEFSSSFFSSLWNRSTYVEAYRNCWQHPVKGYPIALVNSCMKNVVLLPTKYVAEKMLNSVSTDEQVGKNYSGFFAGIATVYITTPISVLKARMMTNVPLDTLNPRRLMSGVNAVALRDGIQFGVYFNTLDIMKAQFGDHALIAGMAGVIGYIFSNPLSVIGLNQKTASESTSIPNMTKQIYKNSGAKGFYPLICLSAFGMFARGIAFDQGSKLYESTLGKSDDDNPRFTKIK